MRRRDFLARLGSGATTVVLPARPFRPTFAAAQVGTPPEGSSVHFALTTTEGVAVTEESYRGKWLAVYFGYTFLPRHLPDDDDGHSPGALKVIGPRADAVQAIFVSVDPQRDKPEVLRANTSKPSIRVLSGLPERQRRFPRPRKVFTCSMSVTMPTTAITHTITAPSSIWSIPAASSPRPLAATVVANRSPQRCRR